MIPCLKIFIFSRDKVHEKLPDFCDKFKETNMSE